MNKKFVINKKYALKHVFAYIRKQIKQNAKVDQNISLDLSENHYVNKNAEKLHEENKGQVVVNKKRTKQVSKKMKNNFPSMSNLCLKNKKVTNNIYSSLKKDKFKNPNDSIPRPMKSMPVIPFWKSSFEIMTKANSNKSFHNIDIVDRKRSSWLYFDNSLTSVGDNYVTMKNKPCRQENIYI